MLKLAPSKRPFRPLFLSIRAWVGRGLSQFSGSAARVGTGLALTAFLTSLVPATLSAQGRLLPTTTLHLAGIPAYVEIAATPEVRNRGLMFRESLPPDHGMLFVFDNMTMTCFWMRNTPLPLSIAFIDEAGRIINLRDMQPYSEADHCPKRPMRYALEMPQGWFDRYGIKAGTLVEGLP